MKKSYWSIIIVASIIVFVVLGFSLYKIIDYSKNKTVEVSIDYGFETVNTFSLKIGETVTMKKTPEKEGYTFDGWYNDETCTQPFDFSKKLTKDTTIYAKWTKQ